jgi:manganese efflux pump family protein
MTARRAGSLALVVALLLVAVSLGLSNFAASIGIGVNGADARTPLRVGLVCGAFETGMPVAGVLLGHGLAPALGGAARWIGAGLLIAAGLHGLVQPLRGGRKNSEDAAVPGGVWSGRILITGLALSIDNLAAGFALGAYRVSLAVAAIVIGAVSVALSLAGLELGSRIGAHAAERGELIGGVVLIGVGIAIAARVI